MSWFADLAVRAKGLLNQVDQGATTALRQEITSSSSYSKNPDYPEPHQQNTDTTYQTQQKAKCVSSAADEPDIRKLAQRMW